MFPRYLCLPGMSARLLSYLHKNANSFWVCLQKCISYTSNQNQGAIKGRTEIWIWHLCFFCYSDLGFWKCFRSLTASIPCILEIIQVAAIATILWITPGNNMSVHSKRSKSPFVSCYLLDMMQLILNMLAIGSGILRSKNTSRSVLRRGNGTLIHIYI